MRLSSRASFGIPWAVLGPHSTPLATFAVAVIFNWWGNYRTSLPSLHLENREGVCIHSIPSHPF